MAEGHDNIKHNYSEEANKFWSIYVTEAEQHDKNLTDTWKADMDSTLIFAGLFSAVITAFIIDSYKLLKQDPADTTAVLLTQILTVQIASYNHDNSSIPKLPVATPSSSSAPTPSAIAINIFWFLSLAFSLIAALMIILVQQWIRHYLERVAHHTQPLRRSRSRGFLFDGIEKWKLQSIVEYVPALLHVSLFFFLGGLCLFLFQISIPVACLFLVLNVILVLFYGVATLTPVYDLSSPFETPLSSVSWYIYTLVQNLKLSYSKRSHSNDPEVAHRETPGHVLPRLSPSRDLAVARRQYTLNPASENHNFVEMDARAFMWALKRTIDDNELEKLAESIPGFLSSSSGQLTWTFIHEKLCQPMEPFTGKKIFDLEPASKKVAGLLQNFVSPLVRLEQRITGLLHPIVASSNMDESLRRRRGMACVRALFTISVHQLTSPHLKPPRIPLTHLPKHIDTVSRSILADTFWDNEAVTMSLCTNILMYHRESLWMRRQTTSKGSTMELYGHCIAADKLLHDVEDLDQLLIDVFDEARAGGHLTETAKADIGNLLLIYFSVLDKKSCELAAHVEYVAGCIPIRSPSAHAYLLERCLAFQMLRTKTTPGQGLIVSENLLFSHQLLALMRYHGLYPSLIDRKHLAIPREVHNWLHVEDARLSGDPSSPFHYLLQELQSITSLVHLIGRLTRPIQVELSEPKIRIALPVQSWSAQVIELENQVLRPESVASFGPFRLLASLLKDSSSQQLLVLMIHLYHYTSKRSSFHPDASAIETTIHCLFPPTRYGFGGVIEEFKSSAMFAAATESILTWERDSKLLQNKALSLFPQKVTDYLVRALGRGYIEEGMDLRLDILSIFRRVYGFQVDDIDITETDSNPWWWITKRIRDRRDAYLSQSKGLTQEP